jgi:hypothetical protein
MYRRTFKLKHKLHTYEPPEDDQQLRPKHAGALNKLKILCKKFVLNFVNVKVKLSLFLIKYNMKIYGTVVEVHFHTSTPHRWEKQPPMLLASTPESVWIRCRRGKSLHFPGQPTRSFCIILPEQSRQLVPSSTLILWSSVMYKHNQPAFRITALRDCILEAKLSPVLLGRGFADT